MLLLLKLLQNQRKAEFERKNLTVSSENNLDLDYIYSTGIF
jgi:hypothetical protein